MRSAVVLMCALLGLGQIAVAAVGFQKISVPDAQGKPITVALWYPTNSPPSVQALGLFQQDVAPDGPIVGNNLSIIFISHGTGGSLASHYDTALALAQAGFVVVALTHTGDNSQDDSYVAKRIDLEDRPRQLKRVIDFVLDDWKGRGHIDPNKVGVFGFSLGGFTALVEFGAIPDLLRMAQLCHERPTAPECDFIKQHHGDQLDAATELPTWVHESRIKAAVIAAPAASYSFGAGSLKQVNIPVQLWRGTEDTEAPDAWNSALVQHGLPRSPEVHTVPNAGHFAFLAPCSETPRQVASFICTDAPNFDRRIFHDQFNLQVVAFFSRTLHD